MPSDPEPDAASQAQADAVSRLAAMHLTVADNDWPDDTAKALADATADVIHTHQLHPVTVHHLVAVQLAGALTVVLRRLAMEQGTDPDQAVPYMAAVMTADD